MSNDTKQAEITAPCPFCGVEPDDHDEGSPMLWVDSSDISSEAEQWSVVCSGCGTIGPRRCDEDEAVKLWNDSGVDTARLNHAGTLRCHSIYIHKDKSVTIRQPESTYGMPTWGIAARGKDIRSALDTIKEVNS